MESLSDYVGGLNIDSVFSSFDAITQSENLKNQKVEILNTWKADITQNLNSITRDTIILKNTFTNARNIYNTITGFNSSYTSSVQAKRANIQVMRSGSGCSPTRYKAICDVLDSIAYTLGNNVTGINNKLAAIRSYPNGGNDDTGKPIITEPFVDIDKAFGATGILADIQTAKAVVDTFTISTDANKKEVSKGMNLTTSDRPIDNIRNITFKGI